MSKPHYEMKTDKPQNMNEQQMLQLSSIHFAPYIQLATALIGKARHAGGNMFRHQMDTFAILLDYGYIDPVLLKASMSPRFVKYSVKYSWLLPKCESSEFESVGVSISSSSVSSSHFTCI